LKTIASQVTEDHLKVHRPWGSYQSVDNGDRHQVKRIVVKPGGRLSLQKHHHRSEHWIVVRGAARATVNDLIKTVHENESIYIPVGAVHRLENPGKIPLELIEVQTGSYLGEDDIIRIEDDYRRHESHVAVDRGCSGNPRNGSARRERPLSEFRCGLSAGIFRFQEPPRPRVPQRPATLSAISSNHEIIRKGTLSSSRLR
jgi:mannose-6-phosphate isomerase-like protein (cupin superfamily)